MAERRSPEGKRARHAALLLQSHSILEGMIEDDSTDAVFVKDVLGRYVMCNDATCRLVGKPMAEIVGHDDAALFPADDARSLMEADRQVRETGQSLRTRGELGSDGRRGIFHATRGPLRDETGTLIGTFGVVRDSIARRLAEHALHDSEQRYRALAEWTPVPLVAHRDRCVLYANPAALVMLRASAAEQVVGTTTLDWFPPEARAAIAERGRELTRLGVGGTTAPLEAPLCALDGTRLVVEIQSVNVPFDGEPAVFTALHDVTAQHAAHERLRERERLLRESQRVANIGSYRLDFVAGQWQASEGLLALFGIDAPCDRSIAGWLGLIHPDEQPMMERYLQTEVIGQRQKFDLEYRIVRKNDRVVRWVHGLGALQVDDANAVVAMTGTIQDITVRREAEDAIRSSEERHRAILQSALDGFWVVDLEGRILDVNETYARMSGFDVHELLEMHLADLEVAESRADIAAHIRKIIATGQDRFTSRHRRKDGSAYNVEVSVQYRPADGGRMVAFIQDITPRTLAEAERAAMQEQLQQAQKMESVGRLAGGVAHDFNNMLGVILGNVDLALEQVAPGDPLRGDLDEVRRAAVRSVELTRQLLAFARKQTAKPQVLALNDTVVGMLRMLQRLIGEDIALQWRPGADLWSVRMDPSQVDQVLANLCVNSRDAISGVGTLAIETGNRTLGAEEVAGRADLAAGDFVLLTVSDDGAGMDDETLSHLFEPFYTTKSMGKGTGLGLATVWGIVRQNNGFIDVTSQPGRGTSFRIYLPRFHGQSADSASSPVALAAVRGRETILLTEDEPAILALTARMLRRQGYEVLCAATPGEAIRIAEEQQGEIHLLLTDVVMPEMHGRELARQLQTLYPGIKRMFMSGYTADVIAHRGVLDDGVHFIQKPFTQAALAWKVREALDRGTADAGT